MLAFWSNRTGLLIRDKNGQKLKCHFESKNGLISGTQKSSSHLVLEQRYTVADAIMSRGIYAPLLHKLKDKIEPSLVAPAGLVMNEKSYRGCAK